MVPRQSCTIFAAAVDRLMPGASPAQQARLFDGRASRYQLHNWKRGRATPPQWALDRLAEIFAEHERLVRSAEPSDGPSSRPNIIAWNKKRAAEKAALNAKREAGND